MAPMIRASQMFLPATLLLPSATPALAEGLPPSVILSNGREALSRGCSALLDGGMQLVEGPFGSQQGRIAKAGAVTLLAAVVGGLRYLERQPGDIANPQADADLPEMEGHTEGSDDQAIQRAQSSAADKAASCEREDPVYCEYDGFMNSMYEGTFEGLNAGDLVSAGIAAAVNGFDEVKTDSTDRSLCEAEEPRTPCRSSAVALRTGEAAAYEHHQRHSEDGERMQGNELQEVLTQQYIEAMDGDYGESMEQGYRELRDQFLEQAAMPST